MPSRRPPAAAGRSFAIRPLLIAFDRWICHQPGRRSFLSFPFSSLVRSCTTVLRFVPVIAATGRWAWFRLVGSRPSCVGGAITVRGGGGHSRVGLVHVRGAGPPGRLPVRAHARRVPGKPTRGCNESGPWCPGRARSAEPVGSP